MTSGSTWRRSTSFSRRAFSALALLGSLACPAAAVENAETASPNESFGADSSPRNSDSVVIEVSAEPVVIEGDAVPPEPTLDQLMQKFRDRLSQPPSYVISERQLADGLMEIHTRFGRFCVRAVPSQIQSGVGGDIAIAAPCVSF